MQKSSECTYTTPRGKFTGSRIPTARQRFDPGAYSTPFCVQSGPQAAALPALTLFSAHFAQIDDQILAASPKFMELPTWRGERRFGSRGAFRERIDFIAAHGLSERFPDVLTHVQRVILAVRLVDQKAAVEVDDPSLYDLFAVIVRDPEAVEASRAAQARGVVVVAVIQKSLVASLAEGDVGKVDKARHFDLVRIRAGLGGSGEDVLGAHVCVTCGRSAQHARAGRPGRSGCPRGQR